uniref:Uncharacterized protein n=1 Tax=Ditylenchus dipsaci TaxID=166011 RepID=A0A915D625_9BILA
MLFLIYWQLDGSIEKLTQISVCKFSFQALRGQTFLLFAFGTSFCFSINYVSIALQGYYSRYEEMEWQSLITFIPDFAVKEVLYLNPIAWKIFDSKTFEIVQRFLESISYSQIGISYGGFVLIDKHMILTCASFVVPYAVLCIQVKFGWKSREDIRF